MRRSTGNSMDRRRLQHLLLCESSFRLLEPLVNDGQLKSRREFAPACIVFLLDFS
jgi:hypothetical protein